MIEHAGKIDVADRQWIVLHPDKDYAYQEDDQEKQRQAEERQEKAFAQNMAEIFVFEYQPDLLHEVSPCAPTT